MQNDSTTPQQPLARRQGPRIYPPQLQDHRQWVCWTIEPGRQGKPAKVPINPHTGEKARSNDWTTWGWFAEARDNRRRWGCQGIGFVLAPEDPYVGVDLDHCIDATTGEMAPWAQAIIESLDTYTALSQSGTGVHIIGQGTLPPWGRKKPPIELYCEGRFFALTGQRYPNTPLIITPCQAALDALHAATFPPPPVPRPTATGAAVAVGSDTEILEKMFRSRKGAAILRLWNGDPSGYPSHSEADLSLCSHLAFWTGGDVAQIDALFRQSGLYREGKWSREDYRHRTISKSLTAGNASTPTMRDTAILAEEYTPWH